MPPAGEPGISRELELRLLKLSELTFDITRIVTDNSRYCNFLWDNAASQKNHLEESHICGRLKDQHEGMLHRCTLCKSE